MSEKKPMRLWHVCGGSETGWIAARDIDEATAIWKETISDEDDDLIVGHVPVDEVGHIMIGNEDGDPPQTMAEAFAECVKADESGYIAGSCT